MKQRMRRQNKSVLVLALTLVLITLPAAAHAVGEARLQLSLRSPDLVVGEEVTVDVLVENAPTIYGADVHLIFDPGLLEVVDADKGLDGVQLISGDFIDPAQSFFLQHHVDNETGTIDYALALLNPAPPVEGDGVLVRVTFRAKTDGQTTIAIEDGLFGTQTGETIAPVLESVEISIAPIDSGSRSGWPSLIEALFESADDISSGTTSDEGISAPSRFSLGSGILLSLAGLVVVGLVGGWSWLRRIRRR